MECECGKVNLKFDWHAKRWVCQDCGEDAPEEMQPQAVGDNENPYRPTLSYHIIYEVYVRLRGSLSHVEAAREAIGIVRTKVIPDFGEDLLLTQACPRLYLDPGQLTGYWMVRCILQRQSVELNMGWEDLLDHDPNAIIFGRSYP